MSFYIIYTIWIMVNKITIFTRLPGAEIPTPGGEEGYFEASLFDLITAFSKVLKEIPKEALHRVIRDEFTVSDKIHEILHILVEKSVIYFSELFKNARNKNEIVTIFLAFLELIKLKEVIVKQKAPFGEIELVRNPEWQKQ